MKSNLYIEKFGDPSNRNWKSKETNGCQTFITPNGGEFSITSNQVDFLQSFSSQQESSRMWLLSLGFITAINRCETATSILSSFLENLENPEFRRSIEKGSSMDHSAAVRIRTMCFLHEKFDCEKTREITRKITEKTSDWAVSGKFAENNHGMMLAISLIHAQKIILRQPKENLIAKASDFLESLFSRVFLDNGYANENTIGYHEFYVKSLASLVEFTSAAELNSTMPWLEKTLSLATQALHKVVRPDGSIPPIGESGEYFTKYPSINGIHVFEKCGLAVIKNEDFYLSIICGCSSETHKQMDDASITLQIKGADFFIDGGLFNYDRKSPFRRLLNSQQAHSGIFLTDHDNLMRGEFIIENPDFTASLKHHKNSIVAIKNYAGKVIRREILIPTESGFEIIDTIQTNKTSPTVQRFIIPKTAEIAIHPTHISIINSGQQIVLTPNYRFNVSLTHGTTTSASRGLRSIKFNEILEAQCLEIFQESENVELRIRIDTNLSNFNFHQFSHHPAQSTSPRF